MKVALITSLERGGPVEQAIVLAHGLTARGVDVRATCADEGLAARFAAAGADAEVIPLRHQLDVAGARAVRRFAREADVIHAHDRRTGLWVRATPRPKSATAIVYTAHGIPNQFHPPPARTQPPGVLATVAYKGVDAQLAWRADAVIVPSHAVADDLAVRLRWPRRRLHVIPNGVVPGPAVVRGPLVGTLSVLEPFKGLEIFLQAAAIVGAKRPEQRFAMFGSGSDAARLDGLARDLGLTERLQRPGFRPAHEAIRQLSVYVLSSWWENAPMALLEVMAAGIPVVATAVDGVPEIVDDTTAQLVAPGDSQGMAEAIERLLDDPHLAQAQAEAARERVLSRFTAEHNAAAVLDLYERVLARRAR